MIICHPVCVYLPHICSCLDKKNILVCPLDWGLGHASRMVPVIEMIEKKGGNVIIAADNSPLDFLTQRFPKNTTIKLSGYSPSYPTNGNMALAMIKSLPEMIRKSKRANEELQKIIAKFNICAVISDNRYELATSKIPTVFITHQLNIQTSGWQTMAKPIINKLVNHYVGMFDEIWIPDLNNDFQLSGKLSISSKFRNKSYKVGLLSRFSSKSINNIKESIDVLIILSGPEPQRTILEKLLLSQALKSELKTTILLAKPGENINKKVNNVTIISHLPDAEFAKTIQSAKVIISRPGYSTLMDLSVFNKKAIFIPTPGQTEQEYLAKRLFDKGIAFSQNQNNFDLSKSLTELRKFKNLHVENIPELLENRVDNLLNNC